MRPATGLFFLLGLPAVVLSSARHRRRSEVHCMGYRLQEQARSEQLVSECSEFSGRRFIPRVDAPLPFGDTLYDTANFEGLGVEYDTAKGNGVNGFYPFHGHPRQCELKVGSPAEANSPDGGRSNRTGCSSAAGVYSGVLPGDTELSEIAFVGVGGNSTEAFYGDDKDENIMEVSDFRR